MQNGRSGKREHRRAGSGGSIADLLNVEVNASDSTPLDSGGPSLLSLGDRSLSLGGAGGGGGGRRGRSQTVAFSPRALQSLQAGGGGGAGRVAGGGGRRGGGGGGGGAGGPLAVGHPQSKRARMQLDLAPGEKVLIQTLEHDRVGLVLPGAPDDRPEPGRLYGTNFALTFITQRGLHFRVPLACVSKVEKQGGKRSKGLNAYRLSLECKDFRRLQLCFDPKTPLRRAFKAFLEAHSPAKLDIPDFFAFANSEIFPVNGWTVYDPLRELGRLGVPNDQWRVTTVNQVRKGNKV